MGRSCAFFVRAFCVAFFGVSFFGCAHVVRIEPEPANAKVYVDGELKGEGVVEIERTVLLGDQLRVSAEADGYEDVTLSIPASEWYPWPGLLATIPLMGIVLSLPVLIIPFIGPFIAAAIAVTWAVITSPTLFALALVRKFPDTVPIKLQRKRPPDGVILPSDLFGVPPDLSPNPVPDVGDLPPPDPGKKPPQPTGGNPVP